MNLHFSTGNQQTDQITAGELPLLHEGDSLPPFRRLIVLLPPCELDEIGLASKIWRLGKGQEIAVLILFIVDNTRDESRMRWKSSALAALIRDEHIQVTTRLCSRKCWTSDLGKLLREDDLLVSIDVPAGSRAELTLDSTTMSLWPEPPGGVLTLANVALVGDSISSNWFQPVFMWIVTLGVIAGFLELQVRLIRRFSPWPSLPFLIVSVIAETTLVWLWTSIWKWSSMDELTE